MNTAQGDSRSPLAVLREAVAFAQSERGSSPADIDRDQEEDEALAQVEALKAALQILRCDVRDYFGPPNESGVTYPSYFDDSMKMSSHALQPFTPGQDSEDRQ